MKRFLSMTLLAAFLLPVAQASAVRYGTKKKIALGGTAMMPQYLVHSSVSNIVYCGNTGAGTVSYLSGGSDTLLGTVAGAAPGAMVYDATHNRVFMHDNGVNFYAIDCAANLLDTSFMDGQGGGPVAYSAVSNRLYYLDGTFNQVHAYDGTTYATATPFAGSGGLCYYQPGNTLYTAKPGVDSMLVYGGANDSLLATFQVVGLAASAGRMAANPAAGRLYAALNSQDRVAIINPATNSVLSSPAVGDNPAAFARCPIDNSMFVACNGSSQYSLWHITMLGTADSVLTGDSVSAVAYNPADSLIYIACGRTGRIKLVNPLTSAVVDSIDPAMAGAHYTELAVDNNGDVYCAAPAFDYLLVVGQIPHRMWLSASNGPWYQSVSWQYSDDGGASWQPATAADTIRCASDSTIQIAAGATIVVDSAVTVDQLSVAGTLVQDAPLTISDGPGDDIAVGGYFRRLSGPLTINSGAVLRILDGGTYQHDLDGGAIPAAVWDTASTLEIDSIITTPITSGLGQSFGTVAWDCQNQAADMTLAADAAFSARNIYINHTGAGRLILTSAVKPRLSIPGYLADDRGEVVLGSGGVHAVSVGGDFAASNYSLFWLTDTLNRGIDTLYLGGSCWFQNIGKGKRAPHLKATGAGGPHNRVTAVGGGGPDSSWVVFNGQQQQDYYDNVQLFTGFVNFRVDSGAFLSINNGQTLGAGSQGGFDLRPGAILGSGYPTGLYPTGQDSGAVLVGGTRSYSPRAGYSFGGFTGGAYYTGPGLPDTVRSLTAAVSYGSLALTRDLTVTGTLMLASQSFSIAGRRLALYGQLINGGGIITSDSSSRLAVLGTAGRAFIPASVAGLDSLVLARPAGIDLGAPLPIHRAFVQTEGHIHSNWLQYDSAAVLLYNRAGADTTSDGEFPVSSGPRNVTINAGGLVHLHADRTVPGVLTLQGWLAAGANTITIDSTGILDRISGFVTGNLAKYVRPGADTPVTYELGEAGNGYAPVTLRLFNNQYAGFVSAGSFGWPQVRVANAPACMQKHWSFTSAGMYADSCRLSLVYAAADFNPPSFAEPADEAAMPAGRFDHGATPGWHLANIIARTPNGTNDGGWLTISHPGLFAGTTPDFQLGRDTMALWAGPDSSAPRAPVNLTAGGSDPSPWYNKATDSVRVRWQNPFDTSGVGLAYYKRLSPPASNGDFTDTVRLSGNSPADSLMLPVATVNALMPLYVWLKDTIGNVDYTKAAMVTVRRDTTAPSGVTVRPFASDTITYTTMYAYVSRGSDALSGIANYRLYCQCDTPGAAWDTVGYLTPDTMLYFGTFNPGYWYKLEATATDSAGNWQRLTGVAQQRVFVRDSFDTVPPTVALLAPDTTARWQTGSLQPIAWTEYDPYAITRRELFYRVNSASPWVAIDSLYGTRPATDTLYWTVPNTPSSQAQVKVVAYDAGGHPGADSSRPFVIGDSIPPMAFGLLPVNGDLSVPVLAAVEVYFTEAIQDTSLRFTCLPAVGGWQHTWTMGSSHLVMTHKPFRPGTNYAVTITGARDLAGNLLDTAGTRQTIFRTRAQRSYAASWLGKRYRLFSLPMVPADSTATGLLGPALGQYSDSTWRMFSYDPARPGFVENPSLAIGHGYWLASSGDVALSLPGSSNDSVVTTLELRPGWNLIGDPFTTSLSLGTLQVAGDTGASYFYGDTSAVVNSTLLRQRMWSYDDSTANFMNDGSWTQYAPFDTLNYRLQPWQGYAVYAISHCRITCTYSKGGGPKAGPVVSQASITWRLRVDAEGVGGADRDLEVGMSPQAREGYDRLDAEKPPLVSNAIEAEIPHPEWRQGPCSGYQYDYRPAAGYVEWPLRVRQRDGDRTGTLRLTASGQLGAGQRAYLVDRQLGTATEVTGGGAVSFTGSREFAVICTDKGLGELRLKPLAFGLDRLYPNPFAGRATISYQVPAAGKVSLKVYNITGQLVATLVDGEQAAGYYAARWDGRSGFGRGVASGVYLVRLGYGNQARTEKLVKLQ